MGGVSVTSLIEMELKTNLAARSRVARIRLTYVEAATDREKTITRDVRVLDFAGTWRAASRRHRLATLGAVWGETMKGQTLAVGLDQRAAELAAQSPGDVRAGELAAVTSASSRLRSSAPTGSAR